jgi:hypothetical protein
MRSRLSTGFHRLGLVLSLPLFIAAAFTGYQQVTEPSGPYVVELPEGAQAWKIPLKNNSERQFIELLMKEQRSVGITAPPDFLVLGVPLGVTRQDGTDWTRYQLYDGREIGIASTDQKAITDTAGNFLYSEKVRAKTYTHKDNIEFDGVRVTFLNPFDQFAPVKNPWPSYRQKDWTVAWLLVAGGIVVYVLLRSIGWVIAGFVGSPSLRPKQ